MVRQNCQYALGQARFHQVEDCLIWIDAICINQDNTDEKNGQVGIMGEIFEWAECVFACIGPIKGAACLVDLAEKLSNSRDCAQDDCPACSLFDPSCTNFDRDEFHVAHTWLESIDAARFKRVVDAFSRFCDNKYWERLWIIQEISLASTVSVVCGRSKIGWRSLTSVQELFNGIVYGTGRPVWSSHTLRSVILDKGIDCRTIDTCMDSQTNALSRLCECYWERQEMDLNNQLPTLGQWKCHDARDRIYSLRRLIRWPAACGPPVPDYSINTIDLAIDVAQRLGSSWVELVRVQWLLSALQVTYEDATSYALAHKAQEVEDTASPFSRSRKTCMRCTCSTPVIPRVVIEDEVAHFALIYSGNRGVLQVTMMADKGTPHHLRLETCIENGRFITIAK